MENTDSVPQSPGGTTTENHIETVTVEATRLPDWQKILIVVGLAFALYKLAS